MIRLFALYLMLLGEGLADPLEKPVVIGASVSAGMHVTELTAFWESPKSHRLALDLALEKEIGRGAGKGIAIPNNGNRFLFFATEAMASRQVDHALVRDPSAVIAVDFLFWYLHGYFRKNEDQGRLERFERGLAQLARFKCPIIVGDIPDATPAIGRVLSASQVPSSAVKEIANTRLREWARSRGGVKILPISTFMEKVMQKKAIEFAGQSIPAEKTEGLLQRDHLHPTRSGVDIIAKATITLLQDFR